MKKKITYIDYSQDLELKASVKFFNFEIIYMPLQIVQIYDENLETICKD